MPPHQPRDREDFSNSQTRAAKTERFKSLLKDAYAFRCLSEYISLLRNILLPILEILLLEGSQNYDTLNLAKFFESFIPSRQDILSASVY